MVDSRLEYQIRDARFGIIGGISSIITTTEPNGSIWVAGELLLYKDMNGVARIVHGVSQGTAPAGAESGDVYVIADQLRWISHNTTPLKEMALINPERIE